MTKFFALTSLSCGVHSPRRCSYRRDDDLGLLSDGKKKRFVIIALREELQQADGRLGKAVQHLFTRVWDKNNPFSWGDDSPAHRVVALEVDWCSIVGIDYRFPLHDDGKLVLEARKVLKRCFKTVEDARDFYSPPASEVRPRWLRTSLSAAPTPSKVSLDGRHAMLSSVSCAHLGSGHLPVSPRLARTISSGPAPPASAAGALRSVASATVASTAAAASGTVSAGGDWSVLGRGRALGPGMGVRLGMEPEPGPRSVSATRAPRTRAAATHLGRASGHCTHMAPTALRNCLDFTSADEGEGGKCRRRPAPAAAAAAAGASGGAGGATAAAGGSARRQLQRRMVDRLAAAGLGEPTACSTRLAAPQACSSTSHTRQLQQSTASPRKAKSTNDLCGMEGDRGDAHSTSTSAAAGAATNARTGLGTQSTEWCTRATAATARISGLHRCNATVCYASRDCSGSLSGGSARRRGGGDSSGAVCSSSVDSLRAAFMSQKYQQMVAGEINSRRRLGGGAGRVCRDTTNWTHLGDASFDGLVDGDSGSGRVPRASRWTQPSATYCSNTLVLSFSDPLLPKELRGFVKSDMRLLKLYESGLPAWAVFMPSYGLPYRPWLRRALWLLFIAISVFSMGCGFYDLYKNVPFLKQVVTAVASRMYLPASELFEWLERHTQIRMSILLTYLFSKSPLLVSLMRAVRSLAALLQQLLRPVAAALSGTLAPLAAVLQASAASIGNGVATACAAVWQAAQPLVAAAAVSGREAAALAAAVLGPPARALWGLAVLLAQLVRLLVALIGMVLVGPVQLVCSLGGALSWAGGELAEHLSAAAAATAGAVRWLLTLGRAARRAAPAVKAGARLAAQAAAAGNGGMGGGGLTGGVAVWHWLGLEVVGAYNAVRLTFMQAFMSARAVMNFCVTVANTAVQHRVSLLLQLRSFITHQKGRLPPAVTASVPLPAFISRPSFSSLAPLDIPFPGPDPDIDQLELDAAAVGLDLAVGMAPAGLAEHHTPAEHHHSMYDMDMDMVMTGGCEDEDLGSILAAAQPQLYGSDAGGVLGSDGAGSDAGGSFSEPIPIPLGGEGPGIAVGNGAELRRRRLHGGVGGRMGLGGGGGGGGVNQRYGLYLAPRQRLDAVDEEDAPQLSDRDSLGVSPRLGGRSADSGGGGGVYVPHDRRRPKEATGGTSGLGRKPWTSGRGHMRGGLCEQAVFEDEEYLAYASAPGCGNMKQGGGGVLVAEDGLYDGYALRPSLSSPSRRQGRGPESAPLSRSVPAAAGPAVDMHCRRPAPGPRQQSGSGQKQPQSQQQQEPLPNHEQHLQQHSRHAKRQLARSASAPAEGTSATGVADAHDGADNDAGGIISVDCGGVHGRCTKGSRKAIADSALTAGALAGGVAECEGTASALGASTPGPGEPPGPRGPPPGPPPPGRSPRRWGGRAPGPAGRGPGPGGRALGTWPT